MTNVLSICHVLCTIHKLLKVTGFKNIQSVNPSVSEWVNDIVCWSIGFTVICRTSYHLGSIIIKHLFPSSTVEQIFHELRHCRCCTSVQWAVHKILQNPVRKSVRSCCLMYVDLVYHINTWSYAYGDLSAKMTLVHLSKDIFLRLGGIRWAQ